MGIPLAEGQTPELLFVSFLLKREGITLPEGKALRLGYSKTSLRDALVKEFKAALLGKAPTFPEEEKEWTKSGPESRPSSRAIIPWPRDCWKPSLLLPEPGRMIVMPA